jgi:hypothetical protein
MTQLRQGDVLLICSEKQLDKKFKPVEFDNGKVILAYGEATGHAHAIDAKACTLYEWQGNRLLEVKKATSLKHEEHSPIALKPGIYEVRRQREYTPEAIRNVQD